MNTLYYGDNLPILREHIHDESVDLIYLDPPFNSNRSYNVLFKDETGHEAEAQIRAFDDSWHWGREAEETYQALVTNAPMGVSTMIDAMRRFIGGNQMMAYLVMMTARLVELHRVLKPTGSLYLHCDPTASHYLKIILDTVFGADRCLNEVVWKRTSAHSGAKRYGPVHDVLLYYCKSGQHTWNQSGLPYDEAYVSTFFDQVDSDGRRWKRTDLTGAGIRHGETGSPWRGIDIKAKGRHWSRPPAMLDELDRAGRIHWPASAKGMPRLKQYPEDLPGVALQDVWTDIHPMHNLSQERLGYPTQKPVALLERIIQASSNPGDVVLDPFCVRKGTLVLVADGSEPPTVPPSTGGRNCGAPSPLTGRAGVGYVPVRDAAASRYDDNNEPPTVPPSTGGRNCGAPSPLTGRAGVGYVPVRDAAASRYDDNNLPPTVPPSTGGREARAPSTGGWEASPASTGGRACAAASPLTGRAGVGYVLRPIESIKPGDLVLGHDGQAHPVLRALSRQYSGRMIGIKRAGLGAWLWVTADHRVLCQRRTQPRGGERSWRQSPPENFGRARGMRREMTPAERRVWALLRGEQVGAKFRRQHPIGPYIADFYSWDAGLVIEIDGDGHFTPEARASDAERDAYLESLGLQVLRFSNTDVAESPEGLVMRVAEAVGDAEPSEDHERQWRRADSVQVGDLVYVGEDQKAAMVVALASEECREEVFDLRVADCHSFVTDVCAIHNCGCGTTIAAAQRLGRTWIGIDITHLAIALQKYRLKDAFGLVERKDYQVIGEPEDVDSARALARDDRYQFQWWALSLVKARPVGAPAGGKEGKKGSDQGVDGVIVFLDDPTARAKTVLVQVKSGKVKSGDIRDLHGVLERDKAEMGVFITLEEPTSDMAAEAVKCGFYHSPTWQRDYPRLQILTVADLLKGAEVKMPPAATTFKQAEKVKGRAGGLEQGELM